MKKTTKYLVLRNHESLSMTWGLYNPKSITCGTNKGAILVRSSNEIFESEAQQGPDKMKITDHLPTVTKNILSSPTVALVGHRWRPPGK
jgi:hypothetical protein